MPIKVSHFIVILMYENSRGTASHTGFLQHIRIEFETIQPDLMHEASVIMLFDRCIIWHNLAALIKHNFIFPPCYRIESSSSSYIQR